MKYFRISCRCSHQVRDSTTKRIPTIMTATSLCQGSLLLATTLSLFIQKSWKNQMKCSISTLHVIEKMAVFVTSALHDLPKLIKFNSEDFYVIIVLWQLQDLQDHGCHCVCMYYNYYIFEGSLEVKLPTIWTDEKQSREEAERRERLEERRVRRKKMQMREKVGKSRKTVFFQWFGAPEGRKVGSLKRRVRSQLARWEMKNCTPLWREAHFEVKM